MTKDISYTYHNHFLYDQSNLIEATQKYVAYRTFSGFEMSFFSVIRCSQPASPLTSQQRSPEKTLSHLMESMTDMQQIIFRPKQPMASFYPQRNQGTKPAHRTQLIGPPATSSAVA